MKPSTKRHIVDILITTAVGGILLVKAGFWALLLFPFAMWNFYDGETRSKL